MRKFHDLSEDEQKRAREKTYQDLIAQIAEEVIIIDGKLGKQVTNALKVAANSTDPCAAYRAVDTAIGNELKPLAYGAAEDAAYDENGNVIYEIA